MNDINTKTTSNKKEIPKHRIKESLNENKSIKSNELNNNELKKIKEKSPSNIESHIEGNNSPNKSSLHTSNINENNKRKGRSNNNSSMDSLNMNDPEFEQTLFYNKLETEYKEYKNNIKFIHPGNKQLKDNYSKLISVINSNKDYLKNPIHQKEAISDLTSLFSSTTHNPKFLELYADYLHHDMMKDLEYRNTVSEVKAVLKSFFIRKFFRLNNILEKVITKYNMLKNFNSEDNKIFNYSNKLSKNNINEVFDNKGDKQFKDSSLYDFNQKNNNSSNNQKILEKEGIKLSNNKMNNNNNDYNDSDSEEDIFLNNKKDYNSFELFTGYKNYKVLRLNQEIEQTLQRILRLSSPEESDNTKDFEFYLKHYKLKKLESIFLKFDQFDTHFHHQIEDINIYLKEQCYKEKLNFQLEFFKPNIEYLCFKRGVDIWKNSRQYLYSFSNNKFQKVMNKLEYVFNEEKEIPYVDGKLLKDYFKNKYSFYYKIKESEENEEDEVKNVLMTSYYDRIHPPMILTINSEIKTQIKELCDAFNIPFDLNIDNGKAFSYSIDLFYPIYFERQAENFSYYAYEYSIRDFNQYKEDDKNNNSVLNKQDAMRLFNKPSTVLRNKYSLDDGFMINNNEQSKIYDKINKESKPIYLKRSYWLNNICIKASRKEKFEIFNKKLNEIGFIDSHLKYELELIDVVDLNTLNRLVDEYTTNISIRVTNTIRIIHKANYSMNTDISNFKGIVNNVVKEKALEDGAIINKGNKLLFSNKNDEEDELFTGLFNNNNSEDTKQKANYNEDYAKLVDGDLLKYFIILRFLKIRDFKFSMLSFLNYFRFIQKRFSIDCYKIENKSWKKTDDYSFIANSFAENWFSNSSNNNKNKNSEFVDINKVYNLNDLINREPISSFKHSNPILPSLDSLLNPQKNYNNYEYYNTTMNNNELFLKVLAEEYDEIADFSQEKGIRIKDSNNNYIIYDSAISDMKDLEKHLAKIGTYFIHQKESLVINPDSTPNPILDRSQIIYDLFDCELEYLTAKFDLVAEFMTVYENTTDIVNQKRLMTLITEIINEQPDIDLDSNYFSNNYHVAVDHLKKKSAFYHTLVDYQKRVELEENKYFHTVLEKTAYLYGEAALDIIRHVKIENKEIEFLKREVLYKKKSKKVDKLKISKSTKANVDKTKDNKANKDKNNSDDLNHSISTNDMEELTVEEMTYLIEIFEDTNKNIKHKNDVNSDIEDNDDEEDITIIENNNSKTNNDDNNNKHLKNKKLINDMLNRNINNNDTKNNIKTDKATSSNNNFKENSNTSFLSNSDNKNNTEAINDINNTKEIKENNENKQIKKIKHKQVNPEILQKKFTKLIKFLKRIITKSLLGNYDEIESLNSSEDLTVNSEEFQSLKEIIDTSVSKGAPKRNIYNITSRSNAIPLNDEFNELKQAKLNFKVRSILNLPNPLKEGSYTNFIEENKRVFPELLRSLQYIKLEEGNPYKISESDPLSSNIEHYESLDMLLDIYSSCNDSLEKTISMFDHESSLSKNAMKISFYEILIEEWDTYKEFSSGRTKSSHFEQIYFLQDTLLDNYQSIIYLMKSLFNTLSQNLENIPPQILCKLNLDKIEIMKLGRNIGKEGSSTSNRYGSLFESETLVKQRLMSSLENNKVFMSNISEENFVKENLSHVLKEYVKEEVKKNFLNLELENVLFSFDSKGNLLLNEVYIYSNLFEVLRTKKVLMKVINNCIQLKDIYENQKEEILNRQEDYIGIGKKFNLESYDKLASNDNYVDCIDKDFLRAERFNISEFDSSMENCSYFSDLTTNFINIINPIELKVLTYHEYLHYYLLLVAVQHNNIIYLPFNQAFAELEMFSTYKITSHHKKINLANFGYSKEPIELSLHQLKQKLKSKLNILGAEYFYKINSKKVKNRNNIIEKYSNFNETQIRPLFKNVILKRIYLREFRLNLCVSYIKDTLIDTFADCIKLQALFAVRRLKEKAAYIPIEYQIFEINNANIIDYEPYKYNPPNKNFLYITDRKSPFVNYYLPSDLEILSLESVTDNDTIYHYTNFNPFNLVENIHHPQFFNQLKRNFPKITYKKSQLNYTEISEYRNYIFDQSYDYHSNLLLLLKLTSFYSQIFDFKFIELAFSQKQIELLRLETCLNKKEDFWLDKKKEIQIFQENEMNMRLPLVIVEKIIQNENNYLNIRHDFIQLKEDIFFVHKDLRSLLKTLNDNDFNPRSLKQIKTLQQLDSLESKNTIEHGINSERNNPSIRHNQKHKNKLTQSKKPNTYNYLEEDTSNHLFSFMELTIHYLSKILINVLVSTREKVLIKGELENFEWLDFCLKQLNYFSHFKSTKCSNPCHLDHSSFCCYSENKDYTELLNKHFDYYDDTKNSISNKIEFYNNNSLDSYFNNYDLTNINYDNKRILNNDFNCNHNKLLTGVLCLDKLLYADIKSNLFKSQNNTEKYMIYLEYNRHNCSLVTLFQKKVEFLDLNINVFKNKLFYMTLLNGDFLNKNSDDYKKLLKKVKEEIYQEDIDFSFEEIKAIDKTSIRSTRSNMSIHKNVRSYNSNTGNNDRLKVPATNNKKNLETKEALQAINEEAKKNDSEGILSKKEEEIKRLAQLKENNNEEENTNNNKNNDLIDDNNIKILLDQDNEKSSKLESTEQIITFLSNYNEILHRYIKETKVSLLKENFKSIKSENLALKEVFSQTKNDLNISQFRNKFSSSLLKNIDETHLININKMYFFFETFINKILNASIEVETHTISSAFIINRDDFESILSELIRDYVSFNGVLRKQESYNKAIEKYGNAFSTKKLTVFLQSTKNKLIDYEDNIEKITNAKLALNSNKLIFEMDNLYRQLKILKENVIVMEDYIQTYFQEKFYYITKKLQNEADEIQNKFALFKHDVNNNTIRSITEEYNNCLMELKSRTLFLTEPQMKVKKNNYANNISKILFNSNNTNTSNNDNINNETHNIQENSNEDNDDDFFFDHFYREIEIETNYNKDINIQRKKTEKLHDQVNQLHLFYRMKIFNMQKKFDMEIDSLKQKLSSNQDLWEKLSIAEKNENILKEELAKTQRNLASNEEFIKKLQSQIQILHDKNVTIEKKLSAMTAQEIISSANQGENIKAKELYTETKSTYVYNLKNNVSLMNAIDLLKKSKLPEALLVCENLETLHYKYSSEIENKRLYINSLNNIKEDISNSREINKMKMQEAEIQIKKLKEELVEVRKELNRYKADKLGINFNSGFGGNMNQYNNNSSNASNSNFINLKRKENELSSSKNNVSGNVLFSDGLKGSKYNLNNHDTSAKANIINGLNNNKKESLKNSGLMIMENSKITDNSSINKGSKSNNSNKLEIFSSNSTKKKL